MSFSAVQAGIQTRLDAIKATSSIITAVYDFHRVSGVEGFPYITFEFDQLGNEFFTSGENLRNYIFRIIVYQEIESTTMGRQAANQQLQNVVDEIIDGFDKDFDLQGICDGGVQAIEGTKKEIGGASGSTLIFDILLNCRRTFTVQ